MIKKEGDGEIKDDKGEECSIRQSGGENENEQQILQYLSENKWMKKSKKNRKFRELEEEIFIFLIFKATASFRVNYSVVW